MVDKIESIRVRLNVVQPFLLWCIGAYMAYSLGYHGLEKLDPDGFWTGAFNRWGYPVWFRMFIGVLEFGGALLMLVPKVRPYGGAILFVVMVGALATRIIFGTSLDDALSISFNALVFLFFFTWGAKK